MHGRNNLYLKQMSKPALGCMCTKLKAVALAAIVMLAAKADQGDWIARAGEPMSDAQVGDSLNRGGSSGAFLADSGQGWTNLANSMNTQNPYASRANHSGFSVRVMEPSAWLNLQKAKAAKMFLPYTFADARPIDRLQVLRVIVNADMPQFVVGNPGNSVAHVVLRSTSRRMVAQPIMIEPFSQGAENDFGATVARSGSIAVFTMKNLDQIRGEDDLREFLITVVGAGHVKGRDFDRDFKVKRKHFSAMGD